MTKMKKWSVLLAIGFFASAAVEAQQLYVYPQKGQSATQQDQDKFECYQWARENTGVDPARSTPTASRDTSGDVAKGMVGGALGGLAIANIAGGSGSKGAAAGAIFGGLGSAGRSSSRQRSQQQQASASQSSYNRAYAACLEGRGYTVK